MPHPTDTPPSIARCIQDFFAVQAIKKLSANTEKAYHSDLHQILRRAVGTAALDKTLIDALDRQTMREAFGKFARDHAKSSISRAHYTWRQFFDFLVADEIVEGSPMGAVPRPKRESGTPKPLDGWSEIIGPLLLALANNCRKARDPWPERDVATFALLLGAGLRSSEFCALNIGTLEGSPGDQIFRVKGKGDKWRTIPIESELDVVLGMYLESRKDRWAGWKPKHADPLFIGSRVEGHPKGGRRMTDDQLYWLVASGLKSSGYENRRPAGAMAHCLRHTYGTSLAAARVPVTTIAALMGHESINTTQGYIQSLAIDQRDGAALSPVYASLGAVIDLRDAATADATR